MNIKGTLYEVVKSGDTYYSNVSGYLKEATAEELSAIMVLKAIAKKATTDEECASEVNAYAAANREIFIKRPVKDIHNILNGQGVEKVMAKQTDDWAADWDGTAPTVVVKEVAEETKVEVKPEEPKLEGKKIKRGDLNKIKQGVKKIMNFFTEFKYTPSNRFIDTFARTEGIESKKEYVLNYFKLTDNMNLEIIAEKLKSGEFDMICSEFEEFKSSWERCSQKVNKRLKIMYGPAGTGKTTEALKLIDGDCDVILCSEDMYPSELQKEFAFDDESGKPVYRPSPLLRAAMEGKKIAFDEFALLPVGSQRFLQGLLDGKEECTTYFGKIKIKEGFEIIATMNLYEGGTTYRVVEPLVDRAYEITEMVLDADKVINNLFCDAEIV